MSDVNVYTDTGTGLYPGPTEPHTVDLSHEDAGPTGAVRGPTEPEVYVSEDHEGAPTGAVAHDPAGDTRYEWPAQPPSAASETKKAPAKKK